MTHSQSRCVWPRIESTWRRKSSSGGSYVAMQIATSGAASETGAGGSATSMRPSGAVVSPSSKRARSASSRGSTPGRGPIRAMPQKPLR